ncbi:MAG: GNAT family N-acetyltransferase [Candidatus Eremiobacteraeota bacterium]|nr:GNAT family N-acetyltransferase [Candidatus Eremiobacteraeota bacterium]
MIALETERLQIRNWHTPEDDDAARSIFCDPEVMRFIPAGTFAPDVAPRVVQRMIERDTHDGFGVWPVVEKSSGALIGECGITYIQESKDVEIAWLFSRASWGNGYATEAARVVLAYALGDVGLKAVYALLVPENRASIAVANRLGMRFDRVVRAYKRDMLRYVAT